MLGADGLVEFLNVVKDLKSFRVSIRFVRWRIASLWVVEVECLAVLALWVFSPEFRRCTIWLSALFIIASLYHTRFCCPVSGTLSGNVFVFWTAAEVENESLKDANERLREVVESEDAKDMVAEVCIPGTIFDYAGWVSTTIGCQSAQEHQLSLCQCHG